MNSKSEKNIDKLFRDKLLEGENQIEFRESDWKALEAKLDAQKKPVSWMWVYSAAAAILVAGILVWFLWTPATRNSNQTVVQNEKTYQPHPVTPKPKKQIPPYAENHIPSSDSGYSANQSKKGTSSKMESRPAGPMTEKKKNAKASISKHPVNNVRFPGSSLPPATFAEYYVVETPPDNNVQQSNSTNGFVKPAGSRARYWSGLTVSLLGASDLNGVGSFQNTSVGEDAGLLLGARFFGKWNIRAGAIYAKKPYTIGYNQYSSANGYQSQYQLNKVRADCRVLDIPVDVNYTLWGKKGNRIGIGAGLSSYLMLRENYYFHYAPSSGQNPKEISIVNQNRHWFSVLNLQLSYERQLSSDLSVGFEPYVKLPLSNIGYEKVRLQSAGLAVVINWRVLNGQ